MNRQARDIFASNVYHSIQCEVDKLVRNDEEYETYLDDSEYEKYPEYEHLLRGSGPSAPSSAEKQLRSRLRSRLIHKKHKFKTRILE